MHPAPQSPHTERFQPFRIALAFVVILVATVATILWLDPALTLQSGFKTIALNTYPIAVLAIGLWALTRRAVLSLLFSLGLVWLVFLASTTKQLYLGTPLLPSDFWMASQVATNPDLFGEYITFTPWTIALLAGFLVVVVGLGWLEPRSFPRRWWIRLPVSAGALLLCYAAFAGLPPTQSVYAQQFGDRVKSVWDPIKLYKLSGLVNGMAFFSAQAQQAVGTPNMGMLAQFDREHAAELAKRRGAPLPKPLPDIYIIQAESLFDPETIVGLDSDDLMPNWHRLEATGLHGTLDSPAFGGVTIRAEFETLTGYPMRAFPTVQYPYYGLVRSGINSLPRDLARMGYVTTVAHPFKSGFWNRKVVMQRFGFQRLLFQDQLGRLSKQGRYVSDEAFFTRLLALPHTDAAGAPNFVFAISMENHGPWLSQTIPANAPGGDIALPEGLPKDAQHELRAYLWHVIDGDRALGKFADTLLARARPTYMVIYGDHLPALKATYPHVSFVDGGSPHSQPVPFMIVSNQPMQSRHVGNMEMSRLPAMLLESAGLPQPGYFAIDGIVADGMAKGRAGAKAANLLKNATWRDYLGNDKAGSTHASDKHDNTPRLVSSQATSASPTSTTPAVDGVELSITPVPTDACQPRSYTARLDWSVPLEIARHGTEIRINAPTGTLMTFKKGTQASARTGNWVKPGTQFYLVDHATQATLAQGMAGTYNCH